MTPINAPVPDGHRAAIGCGHEHPDHTGDDELQMRVRLALPVSHRARGTRIPVDPISRPSSTSAGSPPECDIETAEHRSASIGPPRRDPSAVGPCHRQVGGAQQVRQPGGVGHRLIAVAVVYARPNAALNRENAGQRRASRDIYPDVDQARSRVKHLGSSSSELILSELILKVRPCQIRMGRVNVPPGSRPRARPPCSWE
jgi:hypothetical protein